MSFFPTVEISDPAFERDGLRQVTVRSPALGRRGDVTFFAAGAPVGAMPIIILLHGVYGSHWCWALKGGAHLAAARLRAAGELPECIIAMPSDGLWGDGSGYVPHADHDPERWIVDEVPSIAALAFRSLIPGGPSCIGGLSMGGFGALRLAGKYPSRVAAAAALSTVTRADDLDWFSKDARTSWSSAPADLSVIDALRDGQGKVPPLWLGCGTSDALVDDNRILVRQLREAGLDFEYSEQPGGHDWHYWSEQVSEMLRFFGRALRAQRVSCG